MIQTNKVLKDLEFSDFCSGIGGFRIALESLGGKCVFSCEKDIFAAKVYKKNFGDSPMGDIELQDEKAVPKHHILCAGFPCQPFSISGLGYGFADSRGTIFFDLARIIKTVQPEVVFMENVKNFASHDSGKTLAVVKATMEELGYTFNAKVLNSSDYGIPQQRERIYMVCFKKV